MSDTPKIIDYMMIKLSADELVNANRVAFIESEENYKQRIFVYKFNYNGNYNKQPINSGRN